MNRRALVAAAAAVSAIAVALAVTGGFVVSVGGVRLSARSPGVAFTVAGLLTLAWVVAATRARAVGSDLRQLTATVERHGRAGAAFVALAAGAAAWSLGTPSSSGADASGYLSQAAMWARLDWRLADVLAASPGWPLAAGATSPLGWRPALEQGWQVPTYAPGLPLLMAVPFALAGNAGAFAVVAVSAAVAVWASAALARVLGGRPAGLVAAALVASSPTMMYQALQPMSDVPVAASWALCWWALASARPGAAGMAAASAVLIRPNLAPLAAVPAAWLLVTRASPSPFGPTRRFAFPVAVAGAIVAVLQWSWYGSPVMSGYGSAGELFALANVVPNLRLYGGWLWEAEPAFVVAAALTTVPAIAAAVRVPRRPTAPGGLNPPSTAWLHGALLLFAFGVACAYLVYAQFERWTYVRFLLPALVVLSAILGALVARLAQRVPSSVRGLLVAGTVAAIVASGVLRAQRLEVFDVADRASRATEAGAALRTLLPGHAVLIAGEQSGSMRHETGRPVLRWEALDAEGLRQALQALEARGLEAWWVLDQWEEAEVRRRFATVRSAALDWPPRVEGGRLMRTRAWRVAD